VSFLRACCWHVGMLTPSLTHSLFAVVTHSPIYNVANTWNVFRIMVMVMVCVCECDSERCPFFSGAG
jgi:hypothetical protein